MKKSYENPQARVEEFVANQYVAACNGQWGVACDVDKSNAYEQSIEKYKKGDLDHTSDHCGLSSNQVITVVDSKATKMTEIGTDGLGTLECTVYTNGSYVTKMTTKEFQDIDGGDYIYWTTSAGNRTWHHQGLVTGGYKDHPNRS